MPIDATELAGLRDALIRARARGTRSVEYEGRKLTYATDSEMATALADLERRIKTATQPRLGALRITSSKGV
jgi:hypothetical protein